jgi:hypothetical protein
MSSSAASRPAWLVGAAGQRLLSLALGLPTWAVLGIALWLTPDARGYGTHQQLGLSTCTFMQLTTLPCPMCGMTTCFTHLAHLQPLQALSAQPFGTVLFALTCLIAAVAAVELVAPRGRWDRIWSVIEPREGRVAAALLIGLALGWLYKLGQLGHLPL